jgi:hypothetical protein
MMIECSHCFHCLLACGILLFGRRVLTFLLRTWVGLCSVLGSEVRTDIFSGCAFSETIFGGISLNGKVRRQYVKIYSVLNGYRLVCNETNFGTEYSFSLQLLYNR